MWKYALNSLIVNVLTLVVWKRGNVEMWKHAWNSGFDHITLLSVMLSLSAEKIRKYMSIDISFSFTYHAE